MLSQGFNVHGECYTLALVCANGRFGQTKHLECANQQLLVSATYNSHAVNIYRNVNCVGNQLWKTHQRAWYWGLIGLIY